VVVVVVVIAKVVVVSLVPVYIGVVLGNRGGFFAFLFLSRLEKHAFVNRTIEHCGTQSNNRTMWNTEQSNIEQSNKTGGDARGGAGAVLPRPHVPVREERGAKHGHGH
jgi:hypothetical protein